MKISLMENSFTDEEFNSAIECFKSGRYTQGPKVDEFEKKFADWNDSKHGVMVNSGSSANLLAVFIMKEKYKLQDGDEVLVPAVTWATTIFPVIQNNLKPVFCDVDESYNISLESIKRMTTEKTKAIFAVHILGQPANIQEIAEYCKNNDLILLEDCCESTGATHNGKKVGNFGVMGTFSFYFGHHMTTVEGGMIVTQDEEIADLLKSARSHGWVRGSPRAKKYEGDFISTDFVFDMLGYNLRSTNINASFGLVQLKKLDSFIQTRKENHKIFQELCDLGKLQKVDLDETSSFSLAIMFKDKEERDKVLQELPSKGIECRQIIAGNLLEQPVFKERYKGQFKSDECKMSEEIHNKGIYLPNNQFINKEKIEYMLNEIKKIVGE